MALKSWLESQLQETFVDEDEARQIAEDELSKTTKLSESDIRAIAKEVAQETDSGLTQAEAEELIITKHAELALTPDDVRKIAEMVVAESGGSSGGSSGDGNMDGEYFVGDNHQYKTIQAAVDEVPKDEDGSYQKGGKVWVTDSYDFTKEDFPVKGERQMVTIEGFEGASARVKVPKDADVPAFEMEGVGSTDYRTTWEIKNLRITNGAPAIRAYNSVHAQIQNVTFRGPEGDAIRFEQGPDGGHSFSNKINKVRVLWGGGHGIVLERHAANHDTTISQCVIMKNDGSGVILNGTSNTVRDSSIQHCGRRAIVINSGANVRIKDNYLEKNGWMDATKDSRFPIDIHVRGEYTDALTITGNYFFAMGKSKRAINLYACDTATVRDNRYTGYDKTNGHFIAVHGGAKDVDVHRASHEGDHDDLRNFFAFDGGERTRDGGDIRMTDLSKVEGRYDGDTGWDDGTNTVDGTPAHAVWKDGDWHFSNAGSTGESTAHLRIDASNVDFDHLTYTFTADGVQKSEKNGASINDHDTIEELSDGRVRVSGYVHGGIDAYDVEGDLRFEKARGNAEITVNGKPADVTLTDPVDRKTYTVNKGTEFETAVYDYNGPLDGQTVVILAGQHGTEKSGWKTAEKFVNATFKRGRLVLIPRANPPAIEQGSYNYDQINMNRMWHHKHTSDDLWWKPVVNLWSVIEDADPDVVFDLHSSGGLYRRSPDGVGQAVFPTQAGLAPVSGSPSLDHMHPNDQRYDPNDKTIVDVAMNETNKLVDETHSTKYRFMRGNTQGSGNALLSHKVGADLPNCAGYLIEPTKHETSLDEQVTWQYNLTDELMRMNGFRVHSLDRNL